MPRYVRTYHSCVYTAQVVSSIHAVVNCGILSNPDNGQIILNGTVFESIATYRCNLGYILVGDDTRVCQNSETWSGSQPRCNADAIIGSVVAVLVIVTALIAVIIIVCCIFYYWKKQKPASDRMEIIEFTER